MHIIKKFNKFIILYKSIKISNINLIFEYLLKYQLKIYNISHIHHLYK